MDTIAACAALALPFLEDESFYSWSARVHRITGHVSARWTSQALYGWSTAGQLHDLPSRLGALSSRLAGIGITSLVVMPRTLLHFYLPFQRPDVANGILRHALEGPAKTMKCLLGLPTSGATAQHPLKSCLHCIAADLAEHGFAYWHCRHQWPSCWVCPNHGVPLQYTMRNSAQNGSRAFLLPDRLDASEWRTPGLQGASILDGCADQTLLTNLTRVSVEVLSNGPKHFDLAALRETYRARSIQLGIATLGGKVSVALLRERWSAALHRLDAIPGFRFVRGLDAADGGFVATLMQGVPHNVHPLKHLLLAAMLFEEGHGFLKAYRQALASTRERDPARSDPPIVSPRKAAFLNVMRAGEIGVSAAARRAGVSIRTGCRWAQQMGIWYRRRPVGGDLARGEAIRDLLALGLTHQEIARRAHVKLSTVAAVLKNDSAVRRQWLAQRHIQRKLSHRQAFIAALGTADSPTVTVLRATPQSGTAWLQRHDRAWLQRTLRKLCRTCH